MYEELLTDIGLTKSEIAVYFALLELGSSSTGPIIKKAGIASGKAYLILNKLALKGLVTHVIQSGTKFYQAKDPEKLLDNVHEKQQELKEKEQQLQKVIPTLKAQFAQKLIPPKAEIYEGVKGFKLVYELILKELKSGEMVQVMAVPRKANELFSAYFMEWNRKRIAKGIKMQILYSLDSKDYGKIREQMRLTEVRYVNQKIESPAWVDIFKDNVVTIDIHATPVCFLIKNQDSANSYRRYFETLWKEAKK